MASRYRRHIAAIFPLRPLLDIRLQYGGVMTDGEGASAMPASPSIATCLATRHRPGRKQSDVGGVRRARCVCCGMQLMRTAISRRWIIADQLG